MLILCQQLQHDFQLLMQNWAIGWRERKEAGCAVRKNSPRTPCVLPFWSAILSALNVSCVDVNTVSQICPSLFTPHPCSVGPCHRFRGRAETRIVRSGEISPIWLLNPLLAKNLALSFSNNIVEQVHSFNLLGMTIDDDLKWSTHINTICSKASSRLHSLKVLKRCSLSTSDLLYFYTSAVRPLLEYACPAWHTSLTSEQSKQIERI